MSSGFEIITVSQLNYYVRSQLDSDPMLRNVFVRGEISNFTNHYRSGHLYMSLKDENAVIKAVMFKGSAQHLAFTPENGMKIIAMGRASLYDRDGQFQFYIDDMQPDGVGALHVAFEQLKAKLGAQGLFDESRKRPLPLYPERIGVVTSPTGAALQDIINILGRRWPVASILLYPVLVQGAQAPEQICRAIGYFSGRKAADVLIVGRGGGSIEELWAFNDENVARAVAACEIPVVSAVGHETDFTIADFAADLRAPTPSAAAELVSPDIERILSRIAYLKAALLRGARGKLDSCAVRLDTAVSSRALKEPRGIINAYRTRYGALCAALEISAKNGLLRDNNRFTALASKLEALSPLKVLTRGYSIATGEKGVVTSVGQLHTGDDITLTLYDGTAKCEVMNKLERPDKNI
jgi:exodeoxyribonuclease VII large subunit